MRKSKLAEKILDEKLICDALYHYHKKHLESAYLLKHSPNFEEEFSKTEERFARLTQEHQKSYVKLVKRMTWKRK